LPIVQWLSTCQQEIATVHNKGNRTARASPGIISNSSFAAVAGIVPAPGRRESSP